MEVAIQYDRRFWLGWPTALQTAKENRPASHYPRLLTGFEDSIWVEHRIWIQMCRFAEAGQIRGRLSVA